MSRQNWDHKPVRPRRKPSWWPENEPWPPQHSGRAIHRNRFFRRFGCSLLFLVIAVCGFVIVILGKIASEMGWISIGPRMHSIVPFWFLLAALAIILMIVSARRFFRTTRYINEVLEASDSLAEGDYQARVQSRGPAELHSLGRAFNNMAERLEKSDQIRRNQLADVAHELKTPLTVIQGKLEAMLDGVYAPEEKRLSILHEETETMAALLEDLRTIALAESGALILNKEPTDIPALLNDLLFSFENQVKAKDVQIAMSVQDSMPAVILSPVRMREVLHNLFSNAIRHTPVGGIIEVSALIENEPGSNLIISIKDNGEGIAPEDLELIFERFYKASDSGGMGLGLSIAKKLVEAHGGSLIAKSNPGEGTTMTIRLPIEEE